MRHRFGTSNRVVSRLFQAIGPEGEVRRRGDVAEPDKDVSSGHRPAKGAPGRLPPRGRWWDRNVAETGAPLRGAARHEARRGPPNCAELASGPGAPRCGDGPAGGPGRPRRADSDPGGRRGREPGRGAPGGRSARLGREGPGVSVVRRGCRTVVDTN